MDQNKKKLTITRVFDAPRDLVFKAWSEADRLAKWWGPKGFKLDVAKLDFRPGGSFHYCMTSADGNEMWGLFVYREIMAPERLVFVNSFADKDGNIIRAPFSATWPLEIRNTLELTEHEGKTTMKLYGGPIQATAEERKMFIDMFANMQEGFKGTFEQLDAYLTEVNK